ncbi:MAG: hypothetical protein ACLPTZ_05310 [Beijerinckiaceae bacterium]
MSSDRDQPDSDGNGPSWLTPGIMFAVIGSIASIAAIFTALFFLQH